MLQCVSAMETRGGACQMKYADVFRRTFVVAPERILRTVLRFAQIWQREEMLQSEPNEGFTYAQSAVTDMKMPATAVVPSALSVKTFIAVKSNWFMK